MNEVRTTGIVLILSNNTDPLQLIRSTGSCLKHVDVHSVVIVNRSWRQAAQEQMARIPKMHPLRVHLAKTADPLQELDRACRGMRFTAVIDSLVTLADDSIENGLAEMVGPGDRATVGAVTTRPLWAGALFRTEALRAANGIDLSDMASIRAAVRSDRWKIRKGLEIEESRWVDLGPETIRRLPDRFRPTMKPAPRAGNEIVDLRSRRRSRR